MNPLYQRLRATGYDAEIKRGHVGWRFYLLDPQGRRVSVGKALEELPRTGSESVAAVNARLKGARGFRRDSRFHAVLTAFVEYCEQGVDGLMKDWYDSPERQELRAQGGGQ